MNRPSTPSRRHRSLSLNRAVPSLRCRLAIAGLVFVALMSREGSQSAPGDSHGIARLPAAAAQASDAEPIDQIGGVTRVIVPDPRAADRVFMGVGPRVVAVDLGAPGGPEVIGRSPWLGVGAVIHDLAVENDLAVAVLDDRAVLVLDVSDVTSLRLVGKVDLADVDGLRPSALDVVLTGKTAYVRYGLFNPASYLSLERGALAIIDLFDPSSPSVVVADALPADLHPIAISVVDGKLAVTVTDDLAADIDERDKVLIVFHLAEPWRPAEIARETGGAWHQLARDAAAEAGWILGVGPGGGRAIQVDGTGRIVEATDFALHRDIGFDVWKNDSVAVTRLPDGTPVVLQPSGFGDSVLLVLPVAAPESSERYAGWTPGFPTGALSLVGDRVLVAQAGGRIDMFGVAELGEDTSGMPRAEAGFDLLGTVHDVAFAGPDSPETLIATANVGGLRALEATPGEELRQIGSIFDQEYRDGLTIHGPLSVAMSEGASDTLNVHYSVFDLSVPESLARIGTIDRDGPPVYAVNGVLDGSMLYATDITSSEYRRMAVYDLSEPASARLVDSIELGGEMLDLDLEGDLLVAGVLNGAVGGASIKGFDISDPSAPRLLFGLPIGLEDPLGRSGSLVVRVEDERIWAVIRSRARSADVFAESRLLSIDAGDRSSPVIEGRLTLPGQPITLRVDGDRIYVGMDRLGVIVIDASDPAAPLLAGSLSHTYRGTSDGITSQENLVYVADGVAGLWVYRVGANDLLAPVETPTTIPTRSPTVTIEPPPIGPPTPTPPLGPLPWSVHIPVGFVGRAGF